MGEPGRETLSRWRGEGRRGEVVISFSGAARKPSEILRLARFEDLSPSPLSPSSLEERREGYLSTWHYAAVNVQITPHLLHSKQRSFNDTRTGGGTVVNFSPETRLFFSLSLSFYRGQERRDPRNRRKRKRKRASSSLPLPSPGYNFSRQSKSFH